MVSPLWWLELRFYLICKIIVLGDLGTDDSSNVCVFSPNISLLSCVFRKKKSKKSGQYFLTVSVLVWISCTFRSLRKYSLFKRQDGVNYENNAKLNVIR